MEISGTLLIENPARTYEVISSEKGLTFRFTEALFTYLVQTIPASRCPYFTSLVEHNGDFVEKGGMIKDGIFQYSIEFPFVNLESRKRVVPWQTLADTALQVDELLSLLQFATADKEITKEWFMGGKNQHVTINSAFRVGRGGYVGLGFSPEVIQSLKVKYAQGQVFQTIATHGNLLQAKMTAIRKPDAKFIGSFQVSQMGPFAGVRPVRGVPLFVVMGNCACLGANPDDFSDDHSLSSHNIDDPAQQLAMISMVAKFWEEVVDPLMG